jgi:hypothetical protein
MDFQVLRSWRKQIMDGLIVYFKVGNPQQKFSGRVLIEKQSQSVAATGTYILELSSIC